MNHLCKPRSEPDTSPPEKKAPGRATPARILDSSLRSYHRCVQRQRELCRLSAALPPETWRRLRSLARQEVMRS